ncbi:hypothetical protein V5E97_04175 [Singulisphaera sp. Ch08]|uniref:DUF304 domain-containing protein n=1 Tax=Singulisphaera sp. Ch08 TaxID=3120278 RepID=A0AAU7CIK4_9BACT
MVNPIPARYQRTGSSKIVGCLVYLVVTPFVALFLALFLAVPLMYSLETLGLSRDRASAPFLVLLPLIGVGVVAWSYRDYRRRAALEVVIDRDRVTIGKDSRRTVLRFEDVVSTRLVPTRIDFACVLVSRSGQALRLPAEIAPFSLVREPLEVTLIPEMVRRLDERIARGEAVTLRIPSARILVMMCRGFGALLMSVLMLVNPWRIPMGLLVMRHAITVIRQSWLGIRGGLIIDREGLRHFSDAPATPMSWDRLERIRSDPIGLVLRSRERQVFALSSLTDDFWPALRWINARVR